MISSRRFSVGVVLFMSSVACHDLLGPDEETVRVAEQAICTPRGVCGTCTESGAGGNYSVDYGYAPRTNVCHASLGPCDKTIYCTGSSDTCPASSFEPSTLTCHNSEGDCDTTVNCTGSSAECPNSYKSTSTVCHQKTGPCDTTVTCTGTSATCPNWFEPSSTVCHQKTGECDKTVYCTGASTMCSNWLESSAVLCRAASCTNGIARPTVA